MVVFSCLEIFRRCWVLNVWIACDLARKSCENTHSRENVRMNAADATNMTTRKTLAIWTALTTSYIHKIFFHYWSRSSFARVDNCNEQKKKVDSTIHFINVWIACAAPCATLRTLNSHLFSALLVCDRFRHHQRIVKSFFGTCTFFFFSLAAVRQSAIGASLNGWIW